MSVLRTTGQMMRHSSLSLDSLPNTRQFSELSLKIWLSSFAVEAIDVLLIVKGKLIKEEKRHLDDARREKQVKEHAIHQVKDLSSVCSFPLPKYFPPPHDMVIALESQTKS